MRNLFLNPLLRLLPVGLVALSIQRVVFAGTPMAGVKLQFVLALVVAAGAGGGADRGAVAGFVLGIMYDALGNTPLGLMALAYGLAGMTAAIPVAEAITGESGWIGGNVAVTIPVVALFAALMCPLLMPPGRWMVGAKRRKWKAMVE